MSSAWASAMAALAEAGDRMAAEMESRGLESSETLATMLGALMDTYLTLIGSDPARPAFLPCTGYFQRLGSPNPDTVYRRAPVDPQGTYRLTGTRGAARDVTIMPFSAAMRGGVPFDLSTLAQGLDGQFELVVSAGRPEGHEGHWWQLQPDTASLWLREVSARWGDESPAEVAIVRLDAPPYRRLTAEEMDARLAGLAARVENIVAYGIRHADGLAEQGFVNRFRETDYSKSGAMPLQSYHEALFDLAEDECLLVEARLPADCAYFSWSLTDRMLVTLDWMNAQTSLNSAQAIPDPDGVLRVVVAASDPGVPNWMDTLGHRRGVLQCRSAGSPVAPVMSARVLPLARIGEHLPGIERLGRQERLVSLQERQRAWQMRRLW